MAPNIRDLGIDQLSAEHRLRLIGDIWDSLSSEPTAIPESHREDLDRRLEAADADPGSAIPWEVVRARLRGET